VPLPGVTVRGANDAVKFAGNPVTVRVTGLGKVFPVIGATVIVNAAIEPGSVVRTGVVVPTTKSVAAAATFIVCGPVIADGDRV